LIEELSYVVDSVPCHLLTRQLKTLERDSGPLPVFPLDLPVRTDRRTELIKLRIEKACALWAPI